MKGPAWQPKAHFNSLRKRADIISRMRQFFEKRGILEVETPLLSHATVTDPHIQSIPALFQTLGSTDVTTHYLQTSPEYAMKRLLAAGSGPIYQITKAFRQGEVGRLHNPEFTMLEWYRLDFDHVDLMNEITDFLREVMDVPFVAKGSYCDVFLKYLNIDPFHVSLQTLIDCASQAGNDHDFSHQEDRDFWLTLLFSHYIEPHLGHDKPFFVFDFPSSQAALARVRQGNPPVASRFELYYKGIELANGFHELKDPKEQRQRFENDLALRKQKNISQVPMDEYFLSALSHGLPHCAGVAVGVDRLVMLSLGAETISDVITFPFDRA